MDMLVGGTPGCEAAGSARRDRRGRGPEGGRGRSEEDEPRATGGAGGRTDGRTQHRQAYTQTEYRGRHPMGSGVRSTGVFNDASLARKCPPPFRAVGSG